MMIMKFYDVMDSAETVTSQSRIIFGNYVDIYLP